MNFTDRSIGNLYKSSTPVIQLPLSPDKGLHFWEGIFIYRMDPVKFVKETRRELGKVTWPTRKEIIQMTGLVIIVSLVVAIYIGILDVVMSKILETLLK